MKNAVIFLAEGFEEIEALAPADLLRRAGVNVTLASITEHLTVKGAHGITVTADATAEALPPAPELIVLPGGCPGYENLAASAAIRAAVDSAVKDGRYIAAICGAPAAVLGRRGLLSGKAAVCYPGMENEMTGAVVQAGGVSVDGNFITGKSAGAAIDFALTLVEILAGAQTRKKIKNGIVYHG